MDLIDRQKVIDVLNKHSVMFEFHLPHEFHEVKEEIRGLPSAQPTQENYSNSLDALDCVSRQAIIDALLGITAMRNTIPLDSAIFNIKKLPSAEPHWIPCSERLPDREGRYLVTLPLVNGYPWLKILRYGVPDFDEEYRRRCWYETGDYCDIAVDGIVAWMPLPEPYEEKEEKDGSN